MLFQKSHLHRRQAKVERRKEYAINIKLYFEKIQLDRYKWKSKGSDTQCCDSPRKQGKTIQSMCTIKSSLGLNYPSLEILMNLNNYYSLSISTYKEQKSL